MKVSLVDYTGFGCLDPARQAANILVFAKSTRLKMSPDLFVKIAEMPQQTIQDNLEYISNTIPSSWEFVHYTFLIEGVTRGFTHQFVRTRTASFAQQTMRILDVTDFEYGTGPTIADDPQRKHLYDYAMGSINEVYHAMIQDGASIEDARGILPTNIHTNIVASFNLRTLAELVRKRSSSRVQGEYRDVLAAMKAETLRVHPWVRLFLDRDADKAANELDASINSLSSLTKDEKTAMIKLLDQVRAG